MGRLVAPLIKSTFNSGLALGYSFISKAAVGNLQTTFNWILNALERRERARDKPFTLNCKFPTELRG
jgi:hypothetical protein